MAPREPRCLSLSGEEGEIMKTYIYGLLMLVLLVSGFAFGESVLANTTTTTTPTVGKPIQFGQSKTNYLAYYGYRCYWSAYYGRRVCGYYRGYGYGYYHRGYYYGGYGYHHGYYHGYGYHHGYHGNGHGHGHRYHHGHGHGHHH